MNNKNKFYKKYAKGNPNADLQVISLGMGVQSTAVYLMSSMGYKLPRADVAVFADPQAEHYKTYDMLKWLLKWKEKNNGIEIIVNKDRNIYTDQLKTNADHHVRVPQIPAHTNPTGIAMRQCTYEYKINPVIQTTRKLHGLKPRKREFIVARSEGKLLIRGTSALVDKIYKEFSKKFNKLLSKSIRKR